MFDVMGLRPPERIKSRKRIVSGGSRSGPKEGAQLAPRPLAKVPLFVEEHPDGIGMDATHIEGNFNFNLDYVVARHGPFDKRSGIHPQTGQVAQLEQGQSNIGFADGHSEGVKINFGFTSTHIMPAPTGKGLDGIPYTASGLLFYFGIDASDVITFN